MASTNEHLIEEDDDGNVAERLFERKILSGQLDSWRDELAKIETFEEQQEYYKSVIRPRIYNLENVINYRHERHKHNADISDMHNLPCKHDYIKNNFMMSPDNLHKIITDDFVLRRIVKNLSYAQKEAVYYSAVACEDTGDMANESDTSDRNIRKTKATALRHIRGQLLPVIMFRYKIQTDEKYKYLFESGVSTSFRERRFAALFGEDYADYYADFEIDENTKEDTVAYMEYYKSVMDFVEITKDSREQEQRMKDSIARLKDEARRYKERMKNKKYLTKRTECGNITDDDNSYEKGVSGDYAQDI